MGRIPGPPTATLLLHHGYHRALTLAAVVALASAAAAALLRTGFPHHTPAPGHPVVRSVPGSDRYVGVLSVQEGS
ncbi:hypothetical protein AB0B92_13430 [Streptomyces hygroscopicus]|uniref:hypothetical protein n=1 Tax=Streptomyces hygroscopicus TaxID=1912 RepID=UPI003404980D